MQGPFDDAEPGAPLDVAISEPPIAPVAVSFDSAPTGQPADLPARRCGVPTAARRLVAWTVDLAIVCAFVAANVVAAARLSGQDPLFALARGGGLFAGLAAALSVAWSWLFVAGSARTPGMALTGQRLQTMEGARPGPGRALARALLALVSAAAGLFGFVLALFDPRGQTLHDKLCRCVAVVD